MTTLQDVAARAGVSKSTVSNVISGAVPVADATRARVARAVAETGYHPNVIARSLKARTSTAIGVVVPDLTNPYYAQLVVGIEHAARSFGFAVLTAHTECRPAAELDVGRGFIERRVDGVIIGGMAAASSLPTLLLDRDIPVVLASLGDIDDARVGVIDHDDPAAMEAVVAHLHDLGHRALAFVAHDLREHSGERRRVGFEAALRRRGLAPTRIEDGATAVVAHNDMQAIATIDTLERQGRRVPDDVSVVGYDAIPLAAHNRIRLTTVRSDADAMSRRAIELVVAAARAGRHVGERHMLGNPLVIRATTARAPR